MTIRPLFDRVLVEREDPESRTSSGLFLPEAGQEKSSFARIVAVGTGRVRKDGTLAPLKVEPGMRVLLGKWAGDEIEVDGKELLFVAEKDILAVIG